MFKPNTNNYNSMKPLNVKILYLSFHNLLKKKFGVNVTISRKEVFSELGRHFLVPKPLRIIVLKEMEEMQLIEIKDRDHLVVFNCKIDLETNTNYFLRKICLL